MEKHLDHRPLAPLVTVRVTLVVATILIGGCADAPAPLDRCAGASSVDPAAPVTRIDVRLEAAQQRLVPDGAVTAGGMTLEPTKARLYLSDIALIGEGGERVAAELVDVEGQRLPYELTLIDLADPGSRSLHVRAAAGDYRGLAISVGVPGSCTSGELLNGADASAMQAPLDVDSDMYWSWNSGYVFLKFEGRVLADDRRDPFFYHVGGDDRFAALELDGSFVLAEDGGSGPAIVADFDRLLTSADGAARPDVSDPEQRRVHAGPLADELARNIRTSGFLRLEPAQP
jgi:hypothetical protein